MGLAVVCAVVIRTVCRMPGDSCLKQKLNSDDIPLFTSSALLNKWSHIMKPLSILMVHFTFIVDK